MLPVLVVDRAHMTYRSQPERADLFWPSGLAFDEEVNDTPFAHVALHPRCPRITARALTPRRMPEGSATAVLDGWPSARFGGCTEPGLQAGSPGPWGRDPPAPDQSDYWRVARTRL